MILVASCHKKLLQTTCDQIAFQQLVQQLLVVDKLLVINVDSNNNVYITHKLEDVRKCVNFGALYSNEHRIESVKL